MKYGYNALGYMETVNNTDKSVTFFAGLSTDNFGNFTRYKQANGQMTTKGYDQLGFPTAARAGNHQDLAYKFDWTTGNLLQRRETLNTNDISEEFTYDAANNNRLASATVTYNGIPEPPQIQSYDDNGNITKKSDAGAYEYDHDKINAVRKILDQQTVGLNNQNVKYNEFQMPELITEYDKAMKITYGGDHQRRKMQVYANYPSLGGAGAQEVANTANPPTPILTRYYFGDYEIAIDHTDNDRFIETHYIGGGDGLAAVVKRTGFQRIDVYATYTDYLGSILVADDISTTNPTDIHRNYDAWGKIRRPDDWVALTQEDINNEILADPTEAEAWKWLPRGYTGHEHLLEMDLINMNARLYDPTLARMLAPDNLVGDPTNTQAYNRYSYVWNNPLKYTDPSGNDLVGALAAIGAAVGRSVQPLFCLSAGMYNFVNSAGGQAIPGVVGVVTAVVAAQDATTTSVEITNNVQQAVAQQQGDPHPKKMFSVQYIFRHWYNIPVGPLNAHTETTVDGWINIDFDATWNGKEYEVDQNSVIIEGRMNRGSGVTVSDLKVTNVTSNTKGQSNVMVSMLLHGADGNYGKEVGLQAGNETFAASATGTFGYTESGVTQYNNTRIVIDNKTGKFSTEKGMETQTIADAIANSFFTKGDLFLRTTVNGQRSSHFIKPQNMTNFRY